MCGIGDGRFRWAPRGGAQQQDGVARSRPSHTPVNGPTRLSTTNSNGTIANDTYGFDATDVAGMATVGTTVLGAVCTTGLGAVFRTAKVAAGESVCVVGAGGIGLVDNYPVYVSTGVGMERLQAPQIRFGVRPSVGIIDVVPEPAG